MPSPIAIFAFILATLCGTFFHLLFGGDARRLALYLLAGWLGFGGGQLIGANIGLTLFSIGSLHTFSSVLGAFVALFAARFLVRNTPRTN